MPRSANVAALILVLAAVAWAHPHSAPTLWVDLAIEDGRIVYEVTGLREILHPWFAIAPEAQHPLAEDAQRDAVQGALAYFREHNAVAVAGVRADPRVEYLGKPDNLEGVQALDYMRLKLVFVTDGWPRRADFEWDDVDKALWQNERVVPVLLKYGTEVVVTQFTADERGFSWHSETKPEARETRVVAVAAEEGTDKGIPLLSIALGLLAIVLYLLLRTRRVLGIGGVVVCILAAVLLADVRVRPPWEPEFTLPSNEQAKKIFEQLHANIYNAFEAGSEDEIYDLLAVSVDASLLGELYADIYESLILRDQGGAVCRINEVEVMGGHIDLPEGAEGEAQREFKAVWRWRVDSSVTHWGHTHGRVNRYEAEYVVRHDGRSWKIASVAVVEHERIDDNPDFEQDDGLGSIERIR